MPRLILNNNYPLEVDNMAPKKIKKLLNKHYKLISKKGSKFVFTNDEMTITLWGGYHYCHGIYTCHITQEINNNYRITKYELNSKSIYLWIRIYSMDLYYLKSYMCISTLQQFLFLIDFYNKTNVKKRLNRVSSITKVFRNNYAIRYISEFL
jgi:hypothetical protein